MPPRPTSRCYQAFQSHANVAGDAVWVTDDVLGLAVQRYIDASSAQRRMVSYAPGPMYHRKRFGRRQMTELNSFQSVGSLPAWALPNAPDMMLWQWQPPKPELWSPYPSPSPPCPAPSISEIAPLSESEAALQPLAQPDPSEVTILDESRASNPWKSLHARLHDLRTNHANSSRPLLETEWWVFRKEFESFLSEGRLSGPATADIFITAVKDTQLFERRLPSLARKLRLYLMTHLIKGVESARKADRSFIIPSSKFWNFYMLQIPQQKAKLVSADLLAFALANSQQRHRRKQYDIVLKTLDHLFNLWRGAELHGEPDDVDWREVRWTLRMANMWAGRANQKFQDVEALLAHGEVQEARLQLAVAKRLCAKAQRFNLTTASLMSDDSKLAEKIAIALKVKNPRLDRILYTQATRLLGDPRTTWSRAYYNWLQVMARLPKIHMNQFKRLLELSPRRGHAALSHTELCRLLLLQWESNGKINPDGATRHHWDKSRANDDRSVLAALALAVNKTTSPKTCVAIFWGLWDILRVHGGRRAFLKQLDMLSEREVLSNGFLQRLAWTSNDHRIALLIHNILVRQSGKALNFWWPPFWDKFAARLQTRWKYPLVNPIDLITKLLRPDLDLRPFQTVPSKLIERHYNEQLNKVEMEPLDAQIALYQSSMPLHGKRHEAVVEPNRHEQQIERLKSGLKLLRKSPGVSDRQALHVVTQFTVVLANKQGYLTARDLATLTSVIMRTLDQGRCGSKERFKWFLGVIHRFLGEDVCIKIGLILQRRRHVNWLIWRRGLSRAVGVARQTRDFAQQLKEFQGPSLTPLESLWSKYVGSGRRRARRIRKREAPVRMYRRSLIAMCRYKVDVRKGVSKGVKRSAHSPLKPLRARRRGMTLPATEDEDGLRVMLDSTQ